MQWDEILLLLCNGEGLALFCLSGESLNSVHTGLTSAESVLKYPFVLAMVSALWDASQDIDQHASAKINIQPVHSDPDKTCILALILAFLSRL